MNKTLIAAFTALTLSLGATSAMADGATPANDYWGQKNLEMLSHPARQIGVQAGSSDVNSGAGFRFGPIHATPDRGVATVGGDG
jgi:hypothetical protein